MKKHPLIQTLFWTLCVVFITGCQKKSGNIWEDNQTGGQYIHDEKSTSSLWQSSGDGLAGPLNEEFVPLNDEDLRTQFSSSSVPQPRHDLGEGGTPSAEHFEAAKGALASVFSPIFFDTDQYTIVSNRHGEALNKAAAYLKANPRTYIIIEGHCDERGPEQYNLALGTRRANSVRTYLVKHGVSPDQIHTISFGKEQPFALGHNPDAWSQNRRAHFRIHAQR